MAAVNTIFLIRHGQALNASGRCIGRTDIPLSDEGREEARVLAYYFKKKNLSQIVYSPLSRTHETADIICRQLNIIPKENPAFLEIAMGDWDGLHFSEIKQQWPESYAARGCDFAQFRPPHSKHTHAAENFQEVAKRAMLQLQSFATAELPHAHLRESQTQEKLIPPDITTQQANVAVVTHAGVIRACLCAMSGKSLNELFQFSVPTGSVTAVSLHKGKWKIHKIGKRPEPFTHEDGNKNSQ